MNLSGHSSLAKDLELVGRRRHKGASRPGSLENSKTPIHSLDGELWCVQVMKAHDLSGEAEDLEPVERRGHEGPRPGRVEERRQRDQERHHDLRDGLFWKEHLCIKV